MCDTCWKLCCRSCVFLPNVYLKMCGLCRVEQFRHDVLDDSVQDVGAHLLSPLHRLVPLTMIEHAVTQNVPEFFDKLQCYEVFKHYEAAVMLACSIEDNIEMFRYILENNIVEITNFFRTTWLFIDADCHKIVQYIFQTRPEVFPLLPYKTVFALELYMIHGDDVLTVRFLQKLLHSACRKEMYDYVLSCVARPDIFDMTPIQYLHVMEKYMLFFRDGPLKPKFLSFLQQTSHIALREYHWTPLFHTMYEERASQFYAAFVEHGRYSMHAIYVLSSRMPNRRYFKNTDLRLFVLITHNVLYKQFSLQQLCWIKIIQRKISHHGAVPQYIITEMSRWLETASQYNFHPLLLSVRHLVRKRRRCL